ncbi:MAG TPA: hypothetical protein VFV50_07340, partial [Bdellovibrionales bacterium]|nr:hypothetical protein [Bdellovibrionales bacterium]
AMVFKYSPHAVFLYRPEEERAEVAMLAPYAESLTAKDGKPTIYVCRNFSCEAPTHQLEDALDRI